MKFIDVNHVQKASRMVRKARVLHKTMQKPQITQNMKTDQHLKTSRSIDNKKQNSASAVPIRKK